MSDDTIDYADASAARLDTDAGEALEQACQVLLDITEEFGAAAAYDAMIYMRSKREAWRAAGLGGGGRS